ncbi:hypothetical protein [Actinomyces vulturis]|uniref:hypothetical protein n=1 Tax=Actinomyces vulturis TaxID=1857645 RepID=UPI00082B67D6|nr:hypothetical protein [Actinomyces vulturis]
MLMRMFEKFDTSKVHVEPAEIADALSDRASKVAQWASPHVSKAWDEAVRVAGDAQDKARPMVDDARVRLIEDYVPRARNAAILAQEAASVDGTLAERAQRAALAAKEAAVTPVEVKVKKSHKVLKTFGWLTVAAAAAGAGYILWRRSQPVEDPWAEEYWENPVDEAFTEDPVAEVVEALNGEPEPLVKPEESEK